MTRVLNLSRRNPSLRAEAQIPNFYIFIEAWGSRTAFTASLVFIALIASFAWAKGNRWVISLLKSSFRLRIS